MSIWSVGFGRTIRFKRSADGERRAGAAVWRTSPGTTPGLAKGRLYRAVIRLRASASVGSTQRTGDGSLTT